MRSPLFGALATLSIFAPLVAVPVLALLGLPQAPGAASNQPDDLKFIDQPAASALASLNSATSATSSSNALNDRASATNFLSTNGDSSSAPAVASSIAGSPEAQDSPREKKDPFAEFVRSGPASQRMRESVASAENEPSVPKNRKPIGTIDEGNGLPQKSLLELNSEPKSHQPQARQALAKSPSLSWKDAVDRLNTLGIRDFHLQPGLRDGDFLFSCRFATAANPRITHRFEAEAAEPLDAVVEVLRQIDDWKTREASQQSNSTASSERHSTTEESDPFADRASASTINVTNR